MSTAAAFSEHKEISEKRGRGRPKTDLGETEILNVAVPVDVMELVRREAKRRDRTLAWVVRRLLEDGAKRMADDAQAGKE